MTSLTNTEGGEDGDADDSSSSYDHHYSTNSNNNSSGSYLFKSTPGTPSRRREKERGRQRRQGQGTLRNTRSTPQLRLAVEGLDEGLRLLHLENPRVKQMSALKLKLAKAFPEDRESLDNVEFKTLPPSERVRALGLGLGSFPPVSEGKEHHDVGILGGFVDTRGPAPAKTDERLIHVFVDQCVSFLVFFSTHILNTLLAQFQHPDRSSNLS